MPETTDSAPGTTAADAALAATTGEPEAAMFESAIDEAAEMLLESAAANGATAVHVAVSDPELGEYSQAYGTVAVDGDEASLDDTFPVGSITKTFTAVVILQMVEAGELALDDTVGDLLPDLAARFPDLAPLTVEQLLSMTSGLADYLNVPDSVIVDIAADPMRVWEPEELIAAVVDAGVSPPGTPGYSTTNYIVLQLIAESVGGAPLEELIASMVTGPLGFDRTFLPSPDDSTLPEPFTHGYVAGGCVEEFASGGATIAEGTETTEWNRSYGQGGGGMVSSIDDLLVWAESMSGNSLLGDDLAARRLQVAPIGGLDYGLGMFQVGAWFGHEGEAIGWEALAVQNPETGTSVALAANGCGGIFAGFATFLDTLYPDGEMLAALFARTSQEPVDTGDAEEPGVADGLTSFVAGETILTGTWTSCTWDGTGLSVSADTIDGTARIETAPAGDGVNVSVTGAEEWTGTGTPEEQDGLIVVAGTAAPTADPSAETDLTLVVKPEGCT